MHRVGLNRDRLGDLAEFQLYGLAQSGTAKELDVADDGLAEASSLDGDLVEGGAERGKDDAAVGIQRAVTTKNDLAAQVFENDFGVADGCAGCVLNGDFKATVNDLRKRWNRQQGKQ